MTSTTAVPRTNQASEPTEATESLGAFVARCLAANGVETVFGIPGTHTIELHRGIATMGIQHVLPRHEQGAVFAADGYARASGRPGVVIATSGPGATNCITGIANAYADSVPLLVITPGPPADELRRDLGTLHESKDQRAGMAQFASESIRCESAEAIEQAIHGVFARWRTGRPRPVHLEIPMDVIGRVEPLRAPRPWRAVAAVADAGSIEAAAAVLVAARRPIAVLGGGAADAAGEVRALVDRLGLPIVSTLAGKGVLPEHHALHGGAVAGAGAALPTAEADVVLAIGTELKRTPIAEDAAVIRFDIDVDQLHRHRRAAVPVLGDARENLAALLAALDEHGARQVDAGWATHAVHVSRAALADAEDRWGPLHDAIERGVAGHLSGADAATTGGAILTGDSSQVSYRGTVGAARCARPRSFLTTDGYATLGYSLPAAIGASLADTGRPVVAITGDGALMFAVQELATATDLALPLPIVVVDNAGYAEIEQNMQDAGLEPYAVHLAPPDYAALAAAFGCRFTAARTGTALADAVRDALGADRPTIVHVAEADCTTSAWREEAATDGL